MATPPASDELVLGVEADGTPLNFEQQRAASPSLRVHDPRQDREFYTPNVDIHESMKPRIRLPVRYTRVSPRLLGHGAQGITIKAFDTKTDKDIAIKVSFVTNRSPRSVYKNIVRELKLMRCIRHPNLIELFGAFTPQLDADQLVDIFYVMPLLSGGNLDSYTQKLEASIPHNTLRSISSQILRGVAYLHAHGIWHRDLKPLNICYETTPQNEMYIRILDFGLARRAPDEMQRLTANISTPFYRPIEDLLPVAAGENGNYDEKRDIWAVAVTLGELIHRDYLFFDWKKTNRNTDVEVIKRICCLLGPPSRQYIKRFRDSTILEHRIARAKDYPATFDTTFADDHFESGNVAENNKFRDLLKKLFVYEPEKRKSAAEALRHPYFDQIPQQSLDNIQQKDHLQQILDVYPNVMENEDVNDNDYKQLLFDEIVNCESYFNVFPERMN